MTNELVRAEARPAVMDLMPVLSIEEAISRRDTIIAYGKKVMVADKDYGKIPGTDKDTLLKPGAEKLCTLFALAPRFEILERTEDWTGKDHGGEPFFYYLIKCQLYRGDRVVAESDGSCNSWESRYRYRQGKRSCPKCGKETIFKSKKDSGWYCYAKVGGCGANFAEKDPSIVNQVVGRIKNTDVADIVNTLIKMAEKRALVSATLIATSASEFYTADLEDAHIQDAEYEVRQPEPPPRQAATPRQNGNGDKPHKATPTQLEAIAVLAHKCQFVDKRELHEYMQEFHNVKPGALTQEKADEVIAGLHKMAEEVAAKQAQTREPGDDTEEESRE